MRLKEQAELIAGALEEWASGNKGSAQVAGDVVAAIELLRARPGAPKAVVLFQGDTPVEPERAGRRDVQWKVVVARGRGFRLDTGESLTDGVAGGKGMFELVEEAREVVLGVRLDGSSGETRLVYGGCKAFEVQGIVMDAYELNWTAEAQGVQRTSGS